MDLSSIAPTLKTVPFSGGTVDVKGISFRAGAELIVRYPELLALASGKADIAGLIVAAPDASLAIVAVGIVAGQADSARIMQAFDDAPIGQQIDLLGAIIELTFAGERVGPFLAILATRQSPPSSPSPAISPESSPPSSSG